MKISIFVIIGASLLSLSSFAQTDYEIGELVNNFTITDTEGNSHTLYEITASGKHVYLDFFFDTSPPCQATSPFFGEFYNKYGCNSGDVYCLVINNGTDNDAEVIAYQESYGGPGNYAPAASGDGGSLAVNSDFGITAFPTYVIIGPDNRLIEKDIYPVADVTTFEGSFYAGLNPDPMECSFTTSVDENTLDALSIYPNPANVMASIQFSSETASAATITLYNMLGEVVEANNVQVVAGNNIEEISVANFETGSYIVQIQLGEAIITSKLEVIK